MARTFTLAELRTAVKQRGGVEKSYDLTTSVLNGFINSAAAELQDILRKKGDDALVTSATLTTSIGSATVALPANFYKERLLQIADSSMASGWNKLLPFTLDESHRFGTVTGKNYRYRLQGGNIILSSTTPVVETLRLYYVPWSPIMTSDSDTLDGFNGYEELVIMMAWRKCVERQRLDTSGVDREIARLTARVTSASDGRNAQPFSLVPLGNRYTDFDDDDPYYP